MQAKEILHLENMFEAIAAWPRSSILSIVRVAFGPVEISREHPPQEIKLLTSC